MATIIAFLADETGASAAEYAVILAIVGAAIAAASFVLAGSITGALSDTGACIESKGDDCP